MRAKAAKKSRKLRVGCQELTVFHDSLCSRPSSREPSAFWSCVTQSLGLRCTCAVQENVVPTMEINLSATQPRRKADEKASDLRELLLALLLLLFEALQLSFELGCFLIESRLGFELHLFQVSPQSGQF